MLSLTAIAPIHVGRLSANHTQTQCGSGPAKFATSVGFPPHRSWNLPNDKSGWGPLAIDGGRVLMAKSKNNFETAMGMLTLGSLRVRPLPTGAIPATRT